MFDYFIEFPKDENVLIIAGPNGFGKTQILNILFHLFNKKFSFFQKLVFQKITVTLTNADGNSSKILIVKSKKTDMKTDQKIAQEEEEKDRIKEVFQIEITFFIDNKEMSNDAITLDNISQIDSERAIMLSGKIARDLDLRRIAVDQWVDPNNNLMLTVDDILNLYRSSARLSKVMTDKGIPKYLRTNAILDSLGVHLIKEQRLFKKVISRSSDEWRMTETIKEYAEDLQKILKKYDEESASITRDLESTYPRRLMGEKHIISKEEYEERFFEMKEKQDALKKYGLYESSLEVLEYSQEDAKSLLVYLNDLEKKLGVFDDLIAKLELFTETLNERRFSFKQIIISREKGFYFRTDADKILDLTELSSGEQHEVVLLYELIFKTKPGILVLIDEPEISLHVKWQKEFLNDLLKIIDLQGFQVLVATHSPQIISGRWDLVYNLEKQEV